MCVVLAFLGTLSLGRSVESSLERREKIYGGKFELAIFLRALQKSLAASLKAQRKYTDKGLGKQHTADQTKQNLFWLPQLPFFAFTKWCYRRCRKNFKKNYFSPNAKGNI